VRTRYLADTSVFARLAKPEVTAVFAPLAANGHVAVTGRPGCRTLRDRSL